MGVKTDSDFYEVSDLLTEEQRAIQSTLRDFVNEKIIPVISAHYTLS